MCRTAWPLLSRAMGSIHEGAVGKQDVPYEHATFKERSKTHSDRMTREQGLVRCFCSPCVGGRLTAGSEWYQTTNINLRHYPG